MLPKSTRLCVDVLPGLTILESVEGACMLDRAHSLRTACLAGYLIRLCRRGCSPCQTEMLRLSASLRVALPLLQLVLQLRDAQQCAHMVKRRLTTDQDAEREDADEVFRLGSLVVYSMVEAAMSSWIDRFRCRDGADASTKVRNGLRALGYSVKRSARLAASGCSASALMQTFQLSSVSE